MPTGREHELEACPARLEADPDYKVLRRLKPEAPCSRRPIPGAKLAVMVDVETIGLHPLARNGEVAAEIVEIACVLFSYEPAGAIVAVHAPLSGLRRPSHPIPAFIEALTGISDASIDEAVRLGAAIDLAAIESLFAEASILVAHHAAFDTKYLRTGVGNY